MAHLQRVQPDTVWVEGYKPKGLDLAGIDQNTYVAINGDLGGTWLPIVQITIGGAGVVVAGPWMLSGQLNGVTGPITLNQDTDDDYFQYGPTHIMRTQAPTQLLSEVYCEFPERAQLRVPLSDYAGVHITPWHAQAGNRFMTPLRVHNGSTLVQVQLNFRVIDPLVSKPTTFPRMRVIAVAADGTVLPMRSATDTDTDADGFFEFIPPPTLPTWYQGATMYSMAYGCTQNNVIDVGEYAYFVEIIDEVSLITTGGSDEGVQASGAGGGPLEGNDYVSVNPICTNITLLDSRA